MVLKRVSESAGRGAGGFLGGILNNPGAVAIAGIGLALLFFSGDIRRAFGSLGDSLSGGLANIQFPSVSLPDITFPSIGDINLPEIKLPDITFPEFNFPNPFEGNEGDPRSVPVPEFAGPNFAPGLDSIVAPELGRQDPRRPSGEAPLIEDVAEPFIPNIAGIGTFDPLSLTTLSRDQFNALPENAQQNILESVQQSISPQEQASAIVPESQSQFQERAAAFVENNPILTGSTSLPGSQIITDAPQFTREADRFAGIQEQETRQAEQIFQGLFGDVQNPDFPITLGEFISGKSGDVVSPSLFGASDDQIEQFFSEQGF